jgi:hypothetical protein
MLDDFVASIDEVSKDEAHVLESVDFPHLQQLVAGKGCGETKLLSITPP